MATTVRHSPFGSQVPRYRGGPLDVIGSVEKSPFGNLVLRAGTQTLSSTGEDGWEQRLHIVLTPTEVEDFISLIRETLSE